MSLSENKVRQQVILSKDVKAKIQQLAEADGRSMSNYINQVLKKHIEQINKDPK